MKNKAVIKMRLFRIKQLAIQLRSKYQIPSELSFRISELKETCKEKEIRYLMEQTKHMMRTTNYYKYYVDMENQYNEIIRNDYEKGSF